MGYLIQSESDARLAAVRKILEEKNLDAALVYYDELNIANGWYLTGWCPQFESGAVLVPRNGTPLLLGGPESEPFAKQDSAVKETRNFPVFMVPDEEYPAATILSFDQLFEELNRELGSFKTLGIVGGAQMPYGCRQALEAGLKGVAISDISEEFLHLRYIKSPWERSEMRKAFAISDVCYDAMKAAIKPGQMEIQVAAAGEFAARSRGANGFGFTAIVGSGARGNAVVPTATTKVLQAGEMVMIGLSPKVSGYNGVIGDTLPVSGEYTPRQKECMKYLREAFCLTKEVLKVGKSGQEVDAPARAYFDKLGFAKYLVCPFVHTTGLNEAEAPFFGPNSKDILVPGMTVSIDVSFFGHPEFNGVRIETVYEMTEQGPIAYSPKLDAIHTNLTDF